MEKNPSCVSHPVPDHLVEELTRVFSTGHWLEFESIFSAISPSLRGDRTAEAGEELLRLHIYGRLQNWVSHCFLERQGNQYRAVTGALGEVKNHLAAEHCRDLLDAVRGLSSEAEPRLLSKDRFTPIGG